MTTSTIEQYFWSRAEEGLGRSLEPLDNHDAIFDIIDVYRTVSYNYHTVLDPAYRRKTELFSRELLLTWIGYCINFTAVRNQYKCLSKMGVCLRYQDMEHLVLSEKHLWTIAYLAKSFLVSNFVDKKELFSLRCPFATAVAGEEFATLHLGEVERLERSDAELRSKNYWSKVLEMKARLSHLREELARLQSEKAAIVYAKEQAQRAYDSSFYYDRNGRACHGNRQSNELDRQNGKLRDISRRVDSKQQEVDKAKVAPQRVIQPIPSSQPLTRTWLFFLHMPPPLRTLQSLSFLSQQLLAPRLNYLQKTPRLGVQLGSLSDKLKTSLPRSSIPSHYNTYKHSVYLPSPCGLNATESLVELLGQVEFKIPLPIKDLDQIHSPKDGVWYPDFWQPRMGWLGGKSTDDRPGFEFDPFRIPRESSQIFFTEPLNPD